MYARGRRAVVAHGSFRWNEVYALKQRWGVSVRAIIYRAHFLGLIDPIQYRRANVFLSKSGQTKGEKDDYLVPREDPHLLQDALSVMRDELQIPYRSVARQLGISLDVLRKLTSLALEDNSADVNVTNLAMHRLRNLK